MGDDQESRKHVMMEELMEYQNRKTSSENARMRTFQLHCQATNRIGSFETSISCFVRRKTPCLRLDTVLSLHHEPSSGTILLNIHCVFYKTVNFQDSVSSLGQIYVQFGKCGSHRKTMKTWVGIERMISSWSYCTLSTFSNAVYLWLCRAFLGKNVRGED